MSKRIATQPIQGDRRGNSNWQIGHSFELESTSMAQEGHSLVFIGGIELFKADSDFEISNYKSDEIEHIAGVTLSGMIILHAYSMCP